MGFEMRFELRATAEGTDTAVIVLADRAVGARAEIAPTLGFNCFRWKVEAGGRPTELLYSDPQYFHAQHSTRIGIPILFPFPNRIRGGRFTWDGKEYQLPINDPQQKNAIHGFACRRPWRVLDQGADAASAFVTAEFHGSVDAPECAALWPADYRIRVTYRLTRDRLRIEARADNPDRVPLPFGLGYHPYFRIPTELDDTVVDVLVQAPARSFWELQECLPTGERRPVDERRDLRTARRFSELTLDDVLTELDETAGIGGTALRRRGGWSLRTGSLEILTAPAFRELVLFTPPHRRAICLEPYTCVTDAINLQAQGIDAGWIVLPPGQEWSADVEMRYGP